MLRRRFIQIITMAGAGGLGPLASAASGQAKTVSYVLKGFTCVTCATGLDTLLSQQKGILSSKSTYPEGRVSVRFDPNQTSEQAIVSFIAELGFHVQGVSTKS